MKLLLSFSIAIFSIVACQTKDEQFCNCMEVSDQFNKVSKDVLKSGATKKLESKFKTLKTKKEQACKNYLEMSGKEMLEKKESCEN